MTDKSPRKVIHFRMEKIRKVDLMDQYRKFFDDASLSIDSCGDVEVVNVSSEKESFNGYFL